VSGNVFASLPTVLADEFFETLARSGPVRIERIVSCGHATPDNHWYDQGWDEWILLLAGSAGLLLEGDEQPQILAAGDYLMIPAHRRHRVVWTDTSQKTVWLAVHIGEQSHEQK